VDTSISEFARLSGIPVTTLRHWHKIGLLIPAVVLPYSSYRRYSWSQLPQALLIRWLRESDVSASRIRQLIDIQDPRELEEVLRRLSIEFGRSSRKYASAQHTADALLHQVTHLLPHKAAGDRNAAPMRVLKPLSVAFVGIPGGVGRTPAAVSTASMLHSVGRQVTLVECSPYASGALAWARTADRLGDPLPYPVVALRDLHAVPRHIDVVYDTSNRYEDFLLAAMRAEKVVLCARAGDRLDFSLRHELPLLADAGVDVQGPDFGVMVTGEPDKETIVNVVGDQGRQEEEWSAWVEMLEKWYEDLHSRGLPVLGTIPCREVHRLATLTAPLDFRDHHRVLGSFLGISHLVPPETPTDYMDRLRSRQAAVFKAAAARST
jgi:DNA-binding transcriptional MerR regulator